jgi:hypothetical protein
MLLDCQLTYTSMVSMYNRKACFIVQQRKNQPMLVSVISLLIWVCVLALVVYLILWVLTDVVGLPIPAKVIQILWVIVALIVILWLVQFVLGSGGASMGFPRLR